MGVGESLKDIYYSWEEKWYNTLDRIDEKLPIYKLVDPIDEVFPSFALFLILFFILILVLLLGVFGFTSTTAATLNLSVVDNEGNPVSYAEVNLKGNNETYYTNEYGLVEPIQVILGRQVSVTAKKDTVSATLPILIESTEQNSEIQIKGLSLNLMESKVIQFLSESGSRITDKLTLNFECSTGAEPVESTRDIYNGTANVDVASSCGTLLVTVLSEKYNTESRSLVGPTTTITLTESVPTEVGRAIINLRGVDGNLITEQVTVQAYRATNTYSPEETKVAINGVAVFDLPIGEYKFRTVMEKGYKSSAYTSIYNLTQTSPTTIDINLQKDFVGKIIVTTKVGTTLLSAVKVTIMKGTTEMISKTTVDGEAEFDLTEVGPFNIYATKDGYCEEMKIASAPSDINIVMTRSSGTCGGELKAKVIDQDGKPVVFARVIIFAEKEDDQYKTTYIEKLTDYNGTVNWDPVQYNTSGEKYKIFAFKGAYSGWSTAKEFTSITEAEEYIVNLEVPLGKVSITIKDNYGAPITNEDGNPVYAQLFGDYDNSKITGQRIIEGNEGKIEFEIKAGRKVYAVIKKEGYETYTTIPKLMIGNGVITYNVVLSKPPVEEIQIRSLGLFKNESKVLTVEAGQEYLAMFEIIAPKSYEELGFFVRVGKDDVTKTELDNLFIKEIIAPAINTITTGSTYNKPRGDNIDQDYLNLEESKWGQAVWEEDDYAVGKIIVGAIVKIKENAPTGNDVIAYRAWGIDEDYERDPIDDVLGDSRTSSAKQELYAATKEQIISIGTEALCEETGNNTFCISSTYTDTDGFTNSFETSFDAKNNSLYNLNLKVMSRASVTFDNAAIKLENEQENLYLGNYTIIKPREGITNGTINGYETDWIATPYYSPGTSITMSQLQLTPRKVGSGDLLLRIRDGSKLILEKVFNVNILSDKKMKVEYMYAGKFQDELPKLVSGKTQPLTVKVFNTANDLEITNAIVKLYDRFGTKLTEEYTNKVGVATINIPAALPAEKLVIKIEKPEYETYVKEFKISEDIVEITPSDLSYTLNPQTAISDSKLVKVENKTGFDLTIKEIKLTGKLKGLISESQTESWMNNYKDTIIKSDDYEELEFKVFIASSVTKADDLEAEFEITVGNNYTSWTKKINTKIRVGLGKDVDDPNCLEITKTNWVESTQGKEVQVAFDIINNCQIEGTLVSLKNLGAKNDTTSGLGSMSVQSTTAYVELSKSYNKTFRTTIEAGEKVPIILKFTPYGGVNGTATGTIVFEAKNPTDSKDQVVSTSLEYTINAFNLQECIVIGADLVRIDEDSTGSFSITNNCEVKADFQLNSELALSNKIFSIPAKGSQEVTITRNEGDVPGAYNVLVYGREGNGKQELLGNVKAILDADGCIQLTRYEYDVYDSEYNDYDGQDVGYLRNYCTEKNIGVSVEGEEPYDESKIWEQAIIGAVIGFFKSDCDNFWGRMTGFGCDTNTSEVKLSGKPEQDRINLYKKYQKEILNLASSYRLPTKVPRTPEQVTNKFSAENTKIQAKLDEQITNVYAKSSYWETIKTTGSNLAQAGGSAVGGFFGGVKNLVWDRWTESSTINTTTPTQEAQVVADTQDNLKELIEAQKTDFKDELNKITANRNEFNSKITAAKKEADNKLNALNTEMQGQTKTGSNSSEEIEKQFSAKMEEINTGLEQAYSNAAKEYNTKTKTNKEKIISLLNKNKENLTTYKNKLNESTSVGAAQTAATEAKTAADQAVTTASAAKQAAAKEAATAAGTAKTAKEAAEAAAIAAEKARVAALKVTQLTTDLAQVNTDITDAESEKTRLEQLNLQANPFMKSIYEIRINGYTNLLTKLQERKGAIEKNLETARTESQHATSAATQAATAAGTAKTAADTAVSAATTAKENANASSVAAETAAKEANAKLALAIQNVTVSTNIEKYEIPAIEALITEVNAIELADEKYKGTTTTSTTGAGNASGTTDALSENVATTTSDQALINEFNSEINANLYGGAATAEYDNKHGIFTVNFYGAETVWYKNSKGYWEETDGSQSKCYNDSGVEVNCSTGGALFLLAGTTASTSGNMFGNISSMLTDNMTGIMGGMFANSALGGALISALIEMASAQNTEIQYSDTFSVDKVVIDGVELESSDGISVEMGEVSYDFDSSDSFTTTGESSTPSTSNSSDSNSGSQNNYMMGVNYSPTSLSATQSTVEVRELTFRGNGAVNDTPYQPFTAILTVTATENVYQTDYNYEGIKAAAIARGDYEEEEPLFDWLPSFLEGIFTPDSTTIAEMDANDLIVEETRDYTKEFHLLFNAYEYVDCGPDTYPCPPTTIANCTIDNGKTGSTGSEAAPRLLLGWDWDEVDVDTCDEDNEDYVYCDTTQFTISTLKKLQAMKEFFKANNLTQCPQAIDVAGTNEQEENTLDVAVTRTQFKATTSGAVLEAIVQSNNQLPMDVEVKFNLTSLNGDVISVPQCEITKQVTSEQIYSCTVESSEIGEGTFNVLVTAEPTLCEGCINSVSSNDSLASMLIIGSTNIQDCQEYSTRTDYFSKVLSANNLLSGEGSTILEYTNFTVNLVRDGFSKDFKEDFDASSRSLLNGPVFYTTEGLRELFLSDKFDVEWPSEPSAWKAGKFNARIIVEFNEDNWSWTNDNNNIKKVTVKLEPWGDPEPYHTLYNIGFNGMVGIESDNGRQGYGVSYIQMSEDPVYLTDTIEARADPYNNGVTSAIVSVDDSFYNMNNPVRKGNVLTVNRRGDNVELILSPSVAVPMILSITRNQAMDAYAYYLAEVDGKTQNEMGSTFMQWTGIGQGCFDFSGTGMGNWTNAGDEKSETTGQGYGLRWNNATGSGTVSLYGTMYTPEKSASVIKITAQSESATLETPFGNGSTIIVQSTSDEIGSISDVIEGVKDETICVVGGEYFWNSGKQLEKIESNIHSKENTCIAK